MTVSKITSPPSKTDVQDKINEIIDNLGSGGGSSNITILPISQSDYNALVEKDPNTLYIITTRFLVWGTSLYGNGLWGLSDE